MSNPFAVIDDRLSRIEEVLLEIKYSSSSQSFAPTEELLDRKAAAKFLGIAEQTIYQMGNKLPRRKRFGKLVFLKSELEEFIITGKK